jgi:hypothetical protein
MAGSLALASNSASAEVNGGGPIDAETNATLEVSNQNQNGVYIECSWALEDVDSDFRNGMDYYFGGYAGDSTPGVRPEFEPCYGNPPNQEQGIVHIDVWPNSHDEPTEQYVELWAAVDFIGNPNDPVNLLTVDWEVYHPDGSLKFQVPGRNYADCYGPAGMFDAAIDTGQIEPSSIQSEEGFVTDTIQNLCFQGAKYLYYGAFPISKHQPYGEYTIVAKANDNYGSSQLEYRINVLPFYDLQTDFDSVNWPVLTRNSHRRVIGDFLFSTPDRPTVVNRGNAGIGIEVRLSDMCLAGFEAQCYTVDTKRIDRFDSAFGVRHDVLVAVGDTQNRPNVVTGDQGSDPIPGGEWMYFNVEGDIQADQSLCPNDKGKVEFSLYTKPGQEAGDYNGTVSVRAVPLMNTPDGSYCPTDNGSVYYGDFFYNQYEVNPGLISNTHWGDGLA